jgi:hypothetical protein
MKSMRVVFWLKLLLVLLFLFLGNHIYSQTVYYSIKLPFAFKGSYQDFKTGMKRSGFGDFGPGDIFFIRKGDDTPTALNILLY